jgi:purine-nucleoside phosphorylase
MKNPFDRLRASGADTAIILGSGLGSIVSSSAEKIPYREFAELPLPSVPGHAAQFQCAKVAGKPVIFGQGRVHGYEGYSAMAVTAGVRLLARAGIKTLILTNAAGSLNPEFSPGEWMMITDHINLTGTSPLLGVQPSRGERTPGAGDPEGRWSPIFLDQSEVYSTALRARFAEAAKKSKIVLHQGVYASLLGPQYETPAEVRMLQSFGVDAVGMSTVFEAIQARALGLQVAAFSCLTNFGAGMTTQSLDHTEVIETGGKAAEGFARLLECALA